MNDVPGHGGVLSGNDDVIRRAPRSDPLLGLLPPHRVWRSTNPSLQAQCQLSACSAPRLRANPPPHRNSPPNPRQQVVLGPEPVKKIFSNNSRDADLFALEQTQQVPSTTLLLRFNSHTILGNSTTTSHSRKQKLRWLVAICLRSTSSVHHLIPVQARRQQREKVVKASRKAATVSAVHR